MRLKIARIAVLLAAIAALSSCQAFFTTSIASSLARDTVTVPADISNADAAAILNDTSEPAILASLLEVLNDQAEAGDTAAAALAAKAAVKASNVTTTLTEALNTLMNGGSVNIASIVTDLQTNTTADILQGLTSLGDGSGEIDTAILIDPESKKAKLGLTQLAVATLILASSALPSGITDPADMDAGQLTTFQADPSVILASNLIAQAAKDGGDASMFDFFSDYLP